MKNIKLFTAFFILLSALSLSSCTTEVEPIDPAVLDPILTGCTKPTTFHVSDFVNGNTINLTWVEGGEESSWEIEYGTPGFTLGSGTTVIATDNNLTIDGLDSAIQYQFYIRGVCSDDLQSAWVGPVGINGTSIDCIKPTALSASRNATDPTQAVVTWTAGGAETAWKLQYGPTGFTLGAGTTVPANENTKTLTGLSATQVYDVYVLSACSATDTSNWAGPVHIAIGSSNPESFFKVDLNGTTYNASVTNALIAGGSILISGARGTQGEQISLILNGSTTGTYDSTEDLMVYNPSATSEYDYINSADDDFTENTGSVTITSINTTTHIITGTFHYTGHWSDFTDPNPPAPIEFTNGSFSVPYSTSGSSGDEFSAKIDGDNFVPTLSGAAEATVNDQTVLGIGGINDAGENLSISFKSGLSPGTYDIDGFDEDLASGTYTIGDVDYKATSGSITIISYTSSHVKGTFNFIAVDPETTQTHEVTNGVFDIDY